MVARSSRGCFSRDRAARTADRASRRDEENPEALAGDPQYDFANLTSYSAGASQRTHEPPGLDDAIDSSGMLRMVAWVSALICASQSACPHHGARMNPGRPS